MSTTGFDPVPGSLVVGPREGRTADPLQIGGQEVFVKVAGADTNDQFSCLFHSVPSMSGPPLHQHMREDELFYVIEGEVTFQIDGNRTLAKAGTTLFAPRLTVHAFQNFSQNPALLLITLVPGGLDRMFVEASALTGDNLAAAFGAIGAKYGLSVKGPPLTQ
jgi:quercetin dioxygenase-like cupin family protein